MNIFCKCVDEYYHPRPLLEVYASTWLCVPCIGRFDQETEGYPASLVVDDLGIDGLSLLRPDSLVLEDVE